MSQNRLYIYINNQLCDIAENQSTAFDYTVADIKNPEIRQGSVSLNITLPYSKTNQLILGSGAIEDNTDVVDQSQEPVARVEVGGAIVLFGKARLLGVKRGENGAPSNYNVRFIGTNVNWTLDLDKGNLQTLDFSDQQHVYDSATQLISETVRSDRHYIYPVINYGLMSGTATGSTVQGTAVRTRDRYAMVRVAEIIKRSFAQFSGYTVVSNFLDSAYGQNLWAAFNGKVYRPTLQWRANEAYTIKVLNDTIYSFTNPTYLDEDHRLNFRWDDLTETGSFSNWNHNPAAIPDPSAFDDDGNGVTEQDRTGLPDTQVTIKFSIDGEVTKGGDGSAQQGLGEALVQIVKKNLFGTWVDVNSYAMLFNKSEGRVTKSITGTFTLLAGEELSCRIILGNNFGGTPPQFINQEPLEFVTYKSDETFFNGIIEDRATPGMDIDLNRNLGDVTALQYVKSIQQMFNLHFRTDEDRKTVEIEPFEDFYYDNDQAIDWSDKYDMSKGTNISYDPIVNLGQRINYEFAQDELDSIVKVWNEQNKKKLGSIKAAQGNKFAKGDSTNANPLIAPTFMDTMPEIGLNMTYVAKMWSDDQQKQEANQPVPLAPAQSTEYLPRVLAYALADTENGETVEINGAIRTTIPLAYSYLPNVLKGVDSPVNLMFDDNGVVPGLFSLFYLKLHELYTNSRLITKYISLDQNDINSLNQRFPVKIDNIYYLVNKVLGHDPLNPRSTKVELIIKTFDGTRNPVGSGFEISQITNPTNINLMNRVVGVLTPEGDIRMGGGLDLPTVTFTKTGGIYTGGGNVYFSDGTQVVAKNSDTGEFENVTSPKQ